MQSEQQMLSRDAFANLVRAGQNGRFIKIYADELGVSYQFLAKVLKGKCAPGDQIAKSLGYEQVSMYREIPAALQAAAKAGKKAIVDAALKPFRKSGIKSGDRTAKQLGSRALAPRKNTAKPAAKKKPSAKPKKAGKARRAKK